MSVYSIDYGEKTINVRLVTVAQMIKNMEQSSLIFLLFFMLLKRFIFSAVCYLFSFKQYILLHLNPSHSFKYSIVSFV